MAMENKRITQLSTERLTLTSGDYVMVDDADNGSAKYRLDRLKETDNTLSVSGKAADAAATGQAISDEAEARENADNALGNDVRDLLSAISSVATGLPYNIYPTFQIGYLHGLPAYTPQNPGRDISNNTICTTDYIDVEKAKAITFDSTTYNILIDYYNENKVYQTYVGFHSSPNPYILDSQYSYCVVELRKKDSSAFTDASVADGTVYYSYKYPSDIIRTAEFSVVKKPIQPSILPTLPYAVYRIGNEYACDSPMTNLNTKTWTTIYVDSENGSDSNNGDSTHPVKTLNQAEYLMRKYLNNTIIQIAEDSVFYYDDIPTYFSPSQSMIVRAENNATIIAGRLPTFTASSNHYVSEAFATGTPSLCVDKSIIDDYGLYKPMTIVESESAVDSTEGSFYIDTVNKIVYVHPLSTSSINNILVICSDKYAIHSSQRLQSSNSFVVFENLNVVGKSALSGRESASDTTLGRNAYVSNCKFQHTLSNNVLGVISCDAAYIVNCVAGYGVYDILNYHYTSHANPSSCVVVEINNRLKEGGYYSFSAETSDQLTTCHEGANVLRCNTSGYNADGSLIADINGCVSVCIDCTVVNTAYQASSGSYFAPLRFAGGGKTLLQNCYAYDSRNSLFVTADDLILNGVNYGGTITAANISVGSELL